MGTAHFILTRFNLRLWSSDKTGHACLTDEWLASRFKLFEKYCLPSMAGQTCKDFKWIVLYDDETPKHYVDRFFLYHDMCPQFQPLMVKKRGSSIYVDVFRDYVQRRLVEQMDKEGVDSIRCVTTWFDNDDALHKDFVHAVQDYISRECKGDEVVYFKKGIQYVENYGCAIEYVYDHNHFVSMVENYRRDSKLKTVFVLRTHTKLERLDGVKINVVDDARMLWLEVNHANNVINDRHPASTYKLLTDKNIMNDFSLTIKMTNKIYFNYIFRFLPMLVVVGLKRLVATFYHVN